MRFLIGEGLFVAALDLPPGGGFVGRDGRRNGLVGMDAHSLEQDVGESFLALLFGIARCLALESLHFLGRFGIVLADQFFAVVFFEALEVDGGGLEHVEEQPGFFVGDAVVENGVADFHQGQLNGMGVFERRQLQGEFAGFGAGVAALMLLGLGVVIAVIVTAHGGRSAADAIGFNVAALGNIGW